MEYIALRGIPNVFFDMQFIREDPVIDIQVRHTAYQGRFCETHLTGPTYSLPGKIL
jgi:hypothetical protein